MSGYWFAVAGTVVYGSLWIWSMERHRQTRIILKKWMKAAQRHLEAERAGLLDPDEPTELSYLVDRMNSVPFFQFVWEEEPE